MLGLGEKLPSPLHTLFPPTEPLFLVQVILWASHVRFPVPLFIYFFPFSAPLRIILYICLFYRAETSFRCPVVIKEASQSLFSGNSYSSCCFDWAENVFFSAGALLPCVGWS